MYNSYLSELFQINPDTGNLQSIAIDRESPLISTMYLPQFTLTLRLVDRNGNSRKKRSRTWVNLEDDLQNSASQTIVFVIVDDINDNPPSFVNTKPAVGYPSEELALEILPPYVTTVQVSKSFHEIDQMLRTEIL